MHSYQLKSIVTAIGALMGFPWVSIQAQQMDSMPDVNSVIAQQLPKNSRVLAVTTRLFEGKSYIFIKYEDTAGAVSDLILDPAGRVISAELLPQPKASLLARSLQQALNATPDPTAQFRVNITLQVETIDESGPPVVGSAAVGTETEVHNGLPPKITVNGEQVTEAEALAIDSERQKLALQRQRQIEDRIREKLQVMAARHGLSGHPAIQQAIADASPTVTLEMERSKILELANRSSDLIAGIELYVEPKDQISSAMTSSRVDPYAINYAGRKGGGIGIYMTESGCADAGFITNYQKLAGSRTDHAENVSAIMRAVSPESYIYCRGGAVLPTSSDLNGYNGNPRIHLVNRSNGGGDDDDYTTTDRDWDNFVYNNAVATFVSAGNNGSANGYIIYPSKGLNINSVGAYDDSNNTIANFSSYKDPETKSAKPEISFPGVSITAGGHTMSGTSQSSPHAAAFAADLMSAYSFLQLKPYLMKALMVAGSTKTISGGFDKVGVGAGDFYSAYYNYYSFWWYGDNNSYSYFDSTDSLPNNGYVDAFYNLSSSLSSVRVSLAWLNRGSYTYDHRADFHPIGMDLDVAVYDPNGNYVAGSSSFDNPYESLTFDPQVSGNYRFRIYRYANRDTSSKLHMGLVINW